MEKTRFIDEMQLALLSPEEDPKHSLDDQTAQDVSLSCADLELDEKVAADNN